MQTIKKLHHILIAKKNLCDKGAKVESRCNERGVGGDRLQLGEEQREDVRVVRHVHLVSRR